MLPHIQSAIQLAANMKKESEATKTFSKRELGTLKNFMKDLRREFKYLPPRVILAHGMVNVCLDELGYVVDPKSEIAKQLAALGSRIALTPLVQKLMSLAMVDERSSILKRVRQCLLGKLSGGC